MKKELSISKNIIKLILILICGISYGQTEIIGKVISGINYVTFELKADCEYNEERAESDWKNGKTNLLLVGSIANSHYRTIDLRKNQ